MPEYQTSLPLDAPFDPAPVAPPDLRDEIAAVWGLPLGQRVEVELRGDPVPPMTGILELASPPAFPWDPREPLRLRLAGIAFSHREIARWARV